MNVPRMFINDVPERSVTAYGDMTIKHGSIRHDATSGTMLKYRNSNASKASPPFIHALKCGDFPADQVKNKENYALGSSTSFTMEFLATSANFS